MTKRLTVGKFQIYIEQGVARYSPNGMSIAAVEKELTEYQNFIEHWLEISQPILLPSKPTEDEERLSNMLKASAKNLKRSKFNKSFIATTLESIASLMRSEMASLTEEQTKAIVSEIVSDL